MENLTPPLLKALREIKWLIQSGKPMKEALQIYLEGTNDTFAAKLRENWISKSQNAKASAEFPTYFQNAFWSLISRGCSGQPVLESLESLEAEVALAAEAELDDHLSTLPFKVLIPLLLFQFPAYLLLLLGPMLRELQLQLGG